MPGQLDDSLLELLACPDCRSDLIRSGDGIECSGCNRKFEVRNGTPVLFPASYDMEHLKEEEAMADLMTSSETLENKFALSQWQESKKEFWEAVSKNIGAPPKRIVNIGCGFDDSFRSFQDAGHVFVNFDMVYKMLDTLRSKSGAKHCVAGDVNSLPFRKEAFDCLACIDLIHHESERLEPLLKSFRELLRPGGILFLEDVNAWGMFQFPKSILMPRSVHRTIRSFYHDSIRHSDHRPADYEFPTNPFKVRDLLKRIGFAEIEFFRNRSYPTKNPRMYRIYSSFSGNERTAKYHSFHYLLAAKRA